MERKTNLLALLRPDTMFKIVVVFLLFLPFFVEAVIVIVCFVLV